MSLNTYSTLQTAIADWSHSDDLTAKLPDFIANAEARLNDMLILRDMETESTLTTTVGNNYVPLPTGYVSPIALWIVISSYRQPLEMVEPEELPYYPSNNIPRYWAIDGDNIRLDSPADAVYSLPFRFVQKANLSNANPTNYLLTERQDIYLAGAMVELARYTQNEAELGKWEQKFQQACAGFKARESRNRNVPLRADPALITRDHSFNIYRGI
jgi:hypothetical protein